MSYTLCSTHCFFVREIEWILIGFVRSRPLLLLDPEFLGYKTGLEENEEKFGDINRSLRRGEIGEGLGDVVNCWSRVGVRDTLRLERCQRKDAPVTCTMEGSDKHVQIQRSPIGSMTVIPPTPGV